MRFDPSWTSDETISRLYREDWGRLLSLLVTRTRRLELAEDALGEAFARASERWRDTGVPPQPAGWLYRTAHRLIVDGLRAEAMAARKVGLLAVGPAWVEPDMSIDDLPDERLQLILLCCHPALSPASRSALALRLILGLPTDEIARLFLAAPTAMAARLTRAKKKIVTAGIPLTVPAEQELPNRLDEVCRTIYLAFTAGYTPGAGHRLLRTELAGEALRLAAMLHQLVPHAPQVRALLALLTLQHSRRDAREVDGELITLDRQDRESWHPAEIEYGLGLVRELPADEGYAEELRLQASIAGEHARATTPAATDWSTISSLYLALERWTGSPIVRLNRAVAVAELDGPDAGLALLAGLEEGLAEHHRFHAVRAELARRAGHRSLARRSFESAYDLCTNEVERRFLGERLEELGGPP